VNLYINFSLTVAYDIVALVTLYFTPVDCDLVERLLNLHSISGYPPPANTDVKAEFV
jgi:hypothetical protein